MATGEKKEFLEHTHDILSSIPNFSHLPKQGKNTLEQVVNFSHALVTSLQDKLARVIRYSDACYPAEIGPLLKSVWLQHIDEQEIGTMLVDLMNPTIRYQLRDKQGDTYTLQPCYANKKQGKSITIGIHPTSIGVDISYQGIIYNHAPDNATCKTHIENLQHMTHYASQIEDILSAKHGAYHILEQQGQHNLHDIDEIRLTDISSNTKNTLYKQKSHTIIKYLIEKKYGLSKQQQDTVKKLLFIEASAENKARSRQKRYEYQQFLADGIAFREYLPWQRFADGDFLVYDTTRRAAERFSGNNNMIGHYIAYHGPSTKYKPVLSHKYIQEYLLAHQKGWHDNIAYIMNQKKDIIHSKHRDPHLTKNERMKILQKKMENTKKQQEYIYDSIEQDQANKR